MRGAETNAPLGVFVALADRLAQVVQGAHRVLRHACNRPASVSSRACLWRSNTGAPSHCSRVWIRRLSPDTETWHSCAARLKLDPTEDEEVLEHHQVDHRCAFLNGRAFSVYFARRCLLQG